LLGSATRQEIHIVTYNFAHYSDYAGAPFNKHQPSGNHVIDADCDELAQDMASLKPPLAVQTSLGNRYGGGDVPGNRPHSTHKNHGPTKCSDLSEPYSDRLILRVVRQRSLSKLATNSALFVTSKW